MTRTWPERRTLTPLWITAVILLVGAVVAFSVRGTLYNAVAIDKSTTPELTATVMGRVASLMPLLMYLCVLVLAILAVSKAWVTWQFGLAALAAPACAWVCNWILKKFVAEERPCFVHTIESITGCPTDDWSWPSGHSAMAAGAAVACILLVPKIWPLAAIGALIAAYSRVAVGVHYVHDVLSGLGIGIVTAVIFFYVGNAILQALFPSGGGRHVSAN